MTPGMFSVFFFFLQQEKARAIKNFEKKKLNVFEDKVLQLQKGK